MVAKIVNNNLKELNWKVYHVVKRLRHQGLDWRSHVRRTYNRRAGCPRRIAKPRQLKSDILDDLWEEIDEALKAVHTGTPQNFNKYVCSLKHIFI